MGDWTGLGKIFINIGLIITFLGLIIMGLGKLFNVGKLPGDLFIQKGNFTFYFPLATSIILSIILTIILNLFNR